LPAEPKRLELNALQSVLAEVKEEDWNWRRCCSMARAAPCGRPRSRAPRSGAHHHRALSAGTGQRGARAAARGAGQRSGRARDRAV